MRFRFLPTRPHYDYFPLSQFPFSGGPAAAADHTSAPRLRRRLVLGALFTAALISLLAVLHRYFADYDDDDLDYDDLFELNISYLPFQVFSEPKPPYTSLQPAHALPDSCRDEYFASGAPCYAPETPKFDFLWTWVNGSDPLLHQAKKHAEAQFSSDDPFRPSDTGREERLYRDHDELRHSLRSVLTYFRPYVRKVILLTSDFSLPAIALPPSWRLGQIPQWLDLTKEMRTGWRDGDVTLQIAHHAEIFEDYQGTNFNSLAIETQLGHVAGVADYFIYMNDDNYLATDVTPATFFTSAYGIVLHLDTGLRIPPTRPTEETEGEWRGMGETNYMLSQRFGARHRPYVMHQAKIVSRALLLEANAIWTSAFARSASHLFRETAGPGMPVDINTMFLHGHFIVERAREAMLWAWVVGRVGGMEDDWGVPEARRAWEELGGAWDGEGPIGREIAVRSGHRETLVRERVEDTLRSSGVGTLGRTSYRFSSLDGYAYGTGGDPPRLTPDVNEGSLPQCVISYDECFAGHTRASEVFKNIAFRHPRCGDCVISALVRASGRLGISVFLPDPDRTFASLAGKLPASEDAAEISYLPLVERWEDGAFALRDAMQVGGERNVRAWTEKLLERYRYVIGSSPAMFERLYDPGQAREMLGRVDENEQLTLLCINDDVYNGDEEVAEIFRDWQDRRWSTPAQWEK
ncbi:uncharacterized protein LAESUDRAFT_754314 [Laetiporus sulphureus 93-53]|uniref:Stealth protein CR3 conserved region 3 domain-containing protein n=1 Tax=Laetiporus sulphureus 93-53 TaxID=1314785 RepID=A0A165HI27_9APHY|nr:uncharacterized protein LAESUDRAFT_754314 [Laetiporus sulphureus 93-53]KZT11759.1 hypothetical protein LAESUDRAFT_754314 [Laetiporus sulphureus 93-53]